MSKIYFFFFVNINYMSGERKLVNLDFLDREASL